MSKKKPTRKLSVYSNLSEQRKVKKDANSRRRAEYLATLPKHPVKRFFYRMHPKRFWAYWFSKPGMFMALKIAGVAVLLLALFVGGESNSGRTRWETKTKSLRTQGQVGGARVASSYWLGGRIGWFGLVQKWRTPGTPNWDRGEEGGID